MKKNRFKSYLVSSDGTTAVFRTGYNRHERRYVRTGALIETFFSYSPNDTIPKVHVPREIANRYRKRRINMYRASDEFKARYAAKSENIGMELMSDDIAEALKTKLHESTQSSIEKSLRSMMRKHTVVRGKSRITIYSNAFMRLLSDMLELIKADVAPMNIIEEC